VYNKAVDRAAISPPAIGRYAGLMLKNPFDASEASRRTAGEEIFFRGIVNRITFRNEETGFGVLRAMPEDNSAHGLSVQAVLVGIIPDTIRTGMHILARGEWQTHPKFGKQFKARSLTEMEPTGSEAIERYLGSGAVKGFGPVLAQRIVAAFGEKALEILDNNPEHLLSVPGIGRKKLDEIKAAWEQKRGMREVLLFFQNHSISIGLAQRIYQQYAERSIDVVRDNPYVLAQDVWGIGFHTADQIAAALGTAPSSPERAIAGLLFALKRSSEDGHCYLPVDLLLKKTQALLEVEDEELLHRALDSALLRGEAIREGDRVYSPAVFQAEKVAARALAERIRSIDDVRGSIPESYVSEIIASSVSAPSAGIQKPITLSKQQEEAIHLAADKSLLVITGGPGCGKTTVVRTITRLYLRAGLTIALAAPTGRAAQRLSEVCGYKASTVHRLLKFDPMKRAFVHGKDLPLELDALIVDESSMIDLPLAASLLQALRPKTRLVIVGDADQLPSVGPGLFLADLLSIPEAPRVRLNTLFRRADESHITQIAHQINSAEVPDIPEPDGVTKTDAYFLQAQEAAECGALVERLVVEQIPKRFGLKGTDITVLSPMNQGEIGVISLNERLQRHLVPDTPGIPKIRVGNLEFRLGDRVCQRVNNYQLSEAGVFNGDQGVIIGIDAENRSLIVRLWDGREVTYPGDSLHQLDLAYAITIHRSQGSEVPAIVLILHESHSILLERQLLYTAVTRAKKLLIIVGSRRALVLATKKSRSKRRFTSLTERIGGELS